MCCCATAVPTAPGDVPMTAHVDQSQSHRLSGTQGEHRRCSPHTLATGVGHHWSLPVGHRAFTYRAAASLLGIEFREV